jgi:predicted TIM-barrel fold metal-dependent hydrolase
MTLDVQVIDRDDSQEAVAPVRERPARAGIVDCDVHPTVRGPADLKPYLSERWWSHYQTYGLRPRHGMALADPYPKAQPRAARRDSWAPNGDQPGSNLAFMRENYLEPYNIDHAILSPLNPSGQGEQNVQFSIAMTHATNDWQLDTFTHQERRMKASIVIPYEDPEASVAEIELRANDPDFAQILILTRTNEPIGKRRYWPIFEAACRHDLPVALHVFGYSGHPVSGTGWPSYYVEEMTGHSAACQAAITSLVMEGVFERFPKLKIVIIEGGFAWLAPLAWRLDKHWARLRDEVPDVKRPPSEYIRHQLWITTQPMEEPSNPAHLLQVMEWIGWDRLLFATDYPHWDFDDPMRALPAGLDPARRRQIQSGNARKVYRLD